MKQMHFPSSKHQSVPRLAVLGVFLAISNLHAQTTNWIAPPGSADWFTNTNWDSGVPGPSSTAKIANGGTADINGSIGQVDSLTIGTADGSSSGTLAILSPGTLDVANTLTIQQDGTVTGSGIINVGGTLTNSGSIVSTGGSGNLVSLGIGASATNNAGGSIQSIPVYGSGIYGTGQNAISNGGNIAGYNGIFLYGGGSVTNAGTISGLAGGIILNNGGTITNSLGGTIQATGQNGNGIAVPTSVSVDIINAGNISGTNYAVSVSGGGNLTNEAGGFLTSTGNAGVGVFGGTENITNAGTISGQSGIALSNGSVTNEAGGTITGTSGIAIGSPGAVTLSNAGTINGSVYLGNAANTVTLVKGGIINGDLNLGTNSGSALVLDGTGQEALSQAVTASLVNPGSLTKQGTGTWIVDEYLNVPVATAVNSGTLTVNNTLETGAVTVAAGATLNGSGITQIDAGGTVVNSGTISGLSALELTGGGSVTNNASIIGSTTVPVPSQPWQIPPSAGVSVLNGTGTVTNAGFISGENGVVISGGGTITNQTGGTIQGIALNDAAYNSNTGAGIYSFWNTNPVTVVNEANATIEGTGTYSWGIHTGPATFYITNAGTISGGVNAINVNGGGTLINEAGGFLTSTIFQPVAVTSGGVENIINSGTISSSYGGIGFGDGNPSDSNAGGTVTNNAGGMIQGTGANSFGIATSANNVISVINSGTISGEGSGIILAGGGSVTNNPGGIITGAGGVGIDATSATGTTTVANAGTINGSVNLGNAANTVTLVTGGSISGSLNLGTNSGSALVLDGSGQQLLSQAVTGSISNSGSLTKQGAGVWTIDENLSAAGSTQVNVGTLKVNAGDTLTTPSLTVNAGGTLGGAGTIIANNVINNGGTVAPGDPQTLRIGGDYTQGAGGNLQIDVEGTGPSTYAYDMLLVTGKVTLLAGSVLTLDFLNGFVPVAGDTFDFLQAGGGWAGDFSQVVVEGLTDGFQFVWQSDGSNGHELVTTTPSVADGGQTLTMLLIGVSALIGAKCILQASRQRRVQPSC